MLVNLKPEPPLKLNETFIAFIILILMIITSSKQHLFPAAARTEVDNGGLVRLPPTEKGKKSTGSEAEQKRNCIYKWKSEIQSHFNLRALHNRCLIENSLFQQFGFALGASDFAFRVPTRGPTMKNCVHITIASANIALNLVLQINFWRVVGGSIAQH
jgi:hypothetical protein